MQTTLLIIVLVLNILILGTLLYKMVSQKEKYEIMMSRTLTPQEADNFAKYGNIWGPDR